MGMAELQTCPEQRSVEVGAGRSGAHAGRTADPSASLRDDKKERVAVGKGRLLEERETLSYPALRLLQSSMALRMAAGARLLQRILYSGMPPRASATDVSLIA